MDNPGIIHGWGAHRAPLDCQNSPDASFGILGRRWMLKYCACHQKYIFLELTPGSPRILRIHLIQPIVSLNPPSGPPFHTRRGSG